MAEPPQSIGSPGGSAQPRLPSPEPVPDSACEASSNQTPPTGAPEGTIRGNTADVTSPAAEHSNEAFATDLNVNFTDDEEILADNDSAYGTSVGSDTTSVLSSVAQGVIEHGRRYQTVREGPGKYFVPSDEKQFSSMEAQHYMLLALESMQENPLFRSPIADKAQNILDLGTGDGRWAIDVADMLPSATVTGIDLYPPPTDFVPPNCILEVDDMLKEWTFNNKFDLIHMRLLLGAFKRSDFAKVYKQAYERLEPGGWIEHFESSARFNCDDGTMPKDSHLANWGDIFGGCAARAGNHVFVYDDMRVMIQDAGFKNVHERIYKVPIGDWAKLNIYKDIGMWQREVVKSGAEGYCMFLLTKFGEPVPWSPEEVQVYIAEIRQELYQNYHAYSYHKRVWAQKPYDTAAAAEKTSVDENVATT